MVEKKRLAIIMMGAPGSGKGTQGELLEKNIGFKRYVMSDLIKAELKEGHPLFDRVFKKGELLNDIDIFKIFKDGFKFERQIILDGVPRTEDQAYWLYGFLMEHGYEIRLIHLKVDEKKLIDRITSRKYCPKCHKSYNDLKKRPKVDGVCDDCKCELIQRQDDKAEVFGDRLEIYDKVKKIILDIYSEDLIEVLGDGEILDIQQNIMKRIVLRN
jgi:adenylate kinase